MADFACYWPRYPVESGADGEPATGWLTNRAWLVSRLQRGDRIWLFISGGACGDNAGPHRAHLAQLLVVSDWGHYADHEPAVPGSPRFHIHGVENRCVLARPPVLVDDIFRKAASDPEQHIGIARQTPFMLEESQLEELFSRLRQHYPDVYAAALET